MSFQLPSTQEKAKFVFQQFERIAKRYDLANDVISFGMHRLWKSAAIDALQIDATGHYLDVCCGTGDLAIRIAKRLGTNGQIKGLDFSANMLAVAASRQRNLPFIQAQLTWLRGDAQNLPFENNTFDGSIMSFGLRNLANLEQGLSEMVRVVKPGGKVVNLDLGHPDLPVFSPLYYFFFQRIVPLLGEILQHDRKAYTYLPSSLAIYPKPQAISQHFTKVGLQAVTYYPLALGAVALHVGTVGAKP